MNANPTTRMQRLAALMLLTSLGGCSGGGGSPPPPPPPPPPANQVPTAAARLSGEAVANATTVFDTTGTGDSDGSIVTRSWDYGDGQTGSTDSHVYAAAGSYTATYTVTDNAGAPASATVAVTVAKCSAEGRRLAALSPQYALNGTVCVQTTRGEMVLEVLAAQAPVTTANFLKYVDDGFYGGTLFHRIVKSGIFVAQGGGYTTGLVAKPATYGPIVLESNNGLHNTQYTLAMARTNVPDSATSQFYINVFDNLSLDYASPASPGYAVFGQVISGTTVVDTIGAAATGTNDVPTQEIVIRGMLRLP